ncbi:GTP cyclohydrolase I [Lysinibacter sp. HNR]|uniref:GTP cyclohydrolase I n=1 Tax=Lysinibacter sp. HNR TaxID=3031408 RepID=UPI002435C30E|nr:GTP cyclohydrolase I [Lysinibacter sp. HNR]WGD36814.1 GTP cyclohydrolase I [Lysinibacter sp. HNR]
MNESHLDRARIEAAVLEILAAIGEDPARPGLEKTPGRVADTYAEFFSGVGQDPDEDLAASVLPVGEETGELVLVRGLEFRSMCEHHLLPFVGVAHIAYQPRDHVVGLGAFPRLLSVHASRPQIQERLTEQIASSIQAALNPHGVFVMIDASQGCVTMRGPHQTASTTVSMASRGNLSRAAERTEIIDVIRAAE